MLDIQFIRDNTKETRDACESKGLNPDVVDNLISVDKKRRALIQDVEKLRAARNKLNESLKKNQSPELMSESKELKGKLADLDPELKKLEHNFADLMLQVPNIPLEEVPVGEDESGNVVVREWGKKRKFDFQPKDHLELGSINNWLDLERGSKVAGYRGYFLTGDAVFLQQRLLNYALTHFREKGYTPVIPPVVDKREAFINTGHFPWGESEAYKLESSETDKDNDYFLAGTSEVPLVSMYAGETLREKDLPIKMVGLSPCFRREIGSYGRDTRGFYRVHEFSKIEQVVICENSLETSRQLHEDMLTYTEEMLQAFNIPYRVMLMCTGDMGEPQAKKYDIEAWMPGRDGYGEVASDSIMLDFQSRRANIRYQAADGTVKFVHMLNNTALPSTRWLIALWENYQQEDGSVKLPPVLS